MPATPFDRRPSVAVRAGVNIRARGYLDCAVEQAYHDGLAQWASDDNAPFPDRATIRARLEAELLVLCHGLGTWAAAPPDRIFARIDQAIREADSQRDRDRWDY